MKTGWFALVFAALLALAGAGTAQAQTDAPSVTASPAIPAAQTAVIRIPAGTVVQVELTEPLSSQTSQQEQLFGLRLAEPIAIDGREIVAAGVPGGGEVIGAHPSAFGGRQGRLIISGRFVEIGGQRVRIRGMQITAAGAHRGNTALAVSMIPYAGVAGIFVQGGAIEIPIGARGTAVLASDVDVPIEPSVAPIAEPLTATPTGQATAAGENQ